MGERRAAGSGAQRASTNGGCGVSAARVAMKETAPSESHRIEPHSAAHESAPAAQSSVCAHNAGPGLQINRAKAYARFVHVARVPLSPGPACC